MICLQPSFAMSGPHDQVWKDIERRGLQKIQVDEEETWKDRLKWRRLCTTTTRENGNV
ncbi:hypothetical protein J6590_039441 [Homalodisca vitripennis]|nr:hypothetical protein J6590_039441 [Homalodisca vitripennis]